MELFNWVTTLFPAFFQAAPLLDERLSNKLIRWKLFTANVPGGKSLYLIYETVFTTDTDRQSRHDKTVQIGIFFENAKLYCRKSQGFHLQISMVYVYFNTSNHQMKKIKKYVESSLWQILFWLICLFTLTVLYNRI